MPRYPIPAGRHRVEDHVRRSRFITTITRARTRAEAEAFIEDIRAYASGVSRAVEGMPRREHVDRRLLRVVCDYAARDPVLRLARDVEADLVDEAYGVDVTLVVGVPVGEVARFVDGVAGLTGGAGTVEEGE